MAPKCHRVTRRAGFQQATQSLSHIRYPTDTRQLTSPQGEADVRSLEEVWCCRHWGGQIHLAVDTASKGSPPLLEVRHTHTHTHIETHWDTLRHIETTWDKLRHIETLWDTLRHFETHWDTLRHCCRRQASSRAMRQLLDLDFLLLDIGDYKKIWSCAKTVFWYAFNAPPPPCQYAYWDQYAYWHFIRIHYLNCMHLQGTNLCKLPVLVMRLKEEVQYYCRRRGIRNT